LFTRRSLTNESATSGASESTESRKPGRRYAWRSASCVCSDRGRSAGTNGCARGRSGRSSRTAKIAALSANQAATQIRRADMAYLLLSKLESSRRSCGDFGSRPCVAARAACAGLYRTSIGAKS
jgi:hypothetical protein